VSEDGSVAVTGSADCEVKVWNLEDGSEACVLVGHDAAISSLCMTVGKAMLATGDVDGVVNLWDGRSFEHLMTLNAWYKLSVTCLAFAEITVMDREAGRAGRKDILIAACADGRCKAWDTATGFEHDTPVPHVFDGPIVAMRYLVSGVSALPETAVPAPVNSGVLDRLALPTSDELSASGMGAAVGIDGGDGDSSGFLSARSDRSSAAPNSARSTASAAQNSGVWASISPGSNPFAALVVAARKEKQRQKRVVEKERERANSPAQQAHRSPRMWEMSGQKLTKAMKDILQMQFVEESDGILGSLTADSALAQLLATEGIAAISSVASVDPELTAEAIRAAVRGGVRAWVSEGAAVKQLGIVRGAGTTTTTSAGSGQLVLTNGGEVAGEGVDTAAAAAKRDDPAGVSARDRVLQAHAGKLTIGIGAPESSRRASASKSQDNPSRRQRRRGGLPPAPGGSNDTAGSKQAGTLSARGGASGKAGSNVLDRMVSFSAGTGTGDNRRESMDAIARRQSAAVDPTYAKRIAA